MANRIDINMDVQAHDLHAYQMDRWGEADEWFKSQPLWVIEASLRELKHLANEDGPGAVVYRLAYTALLELVSRAYVRASQMERVMGDDDGD